DGLSTGGVATLMSRPERMHLQVDEPPAGVAAVPAEVVDLVFQGPVVRVALVASDGSAVVAHIGPEEELPMIRPGDPLWITWEPETAVLLHSEPRFVASPQELEIAALSAASAPSPRGSDQ
ncbi:MAG: TOBE domain-containing protein, partial [Acidimicrobiia bacterium]